jgi:hypothetical protein
VENPALNQGIKYWIPAFGSVAKLGLLTSTINIKRNRTFDKDKSAIGLPEIALILQQKDIYKSQRLCIARPKPFGGGQPAAAS